MDDYFEQEIKTVEREILMLKTAMQKSSGEIQLEEKSIDVSIQLALDASRTSARGERSFKIHSNNDVLTFVSLEHYYDDISKGNITPRATRSFSVRKYSLSDGIGITILAYGTEGENSDVSTLQDGGQIVLTTKMTVKCTDSFTLGSVYNG